MNILNSLAEVSEDVGIVIIEMVAPPVLDDVSEHVLHDYKKAFVKDFSKQENILKKIEDFSHDVVSNIKKDFHLIKSISCIHPEHGHTIKEFVERSLIKNGFETAISAAAVMILGLDTLPVAVGAVVIEQLVENFEEKNEGKIVNRIRGLRDKFLHSSKSANSLKNN